MKKVIREKATEKRIRFDIFCKRCTNYECSESDDPCFSCLNETYGYTSIPRNYKKKEDK